MNTFVWSSSASPDEVFVAGREKPLHHPHQHCGRHLQVQAALGLGLLHQLLPRRRALAIQRLKRWVLGHEAGIGREVRYPLRKTGEATPKGYPAEPRSWEKPGRVSEPDETPPPTCS
jgi:hypothetical protein